MVLVTTSSKEEGEKIGRALVERRLAACANIVPSISSIFSWEGKINREQESLMILKSKRGCLAQLIEEVKRQHSYSVPEIIALPIVDGSPEYLKWIRENTEST